MGFSEEDLRREPQDRHFMQTVQTLLQQRRGKTLLQHCLGALCTKTSVGRSVVRQTLETCLMMQSHSVMQSNFTLVLTFVLDVKLQ